MVPRPLELSMALAFNLETTTASDGTVTCAWCHHPIPKGDRTVRVVDYPPALPETLRSLVFDTMEHLRDWSQQAALNAMRQIAMKDPAYLANPPEAVARRDAYAALAQMTFRTA
jgi:hypothetical protein